MVFEGGIIMKRLKIILSILSIWLCGCGTQYSEVAVRNGFSKGVVEVKMDYTQRLLPNDSVVKYANGYLLWPLQQFSEFELSLYDVPNELSQRIAVRKPRYEYEITFKGNTMTYEVQPQKTGHLKIRKNKFEDIIEMINCVTITIDSNTIVYLGQEAVEEILKKSGYGKGNICIEVDSTMLNNRGL